MAPTKEPKGSKKTAVANKDIYARINFLHQASLLLASSSPSLSRTYVSDLNIVCRKSQLRMDPKIKRQLCKRCQSILIDGITANRRIENESRQKKVECDFLVITCDSCQSNKRFRLDGPELWSAKSENIS